MSLKIGLLLFLLLSSLANAGQVITFRSDNWMPMNGDPSADKPGFLVELARAIYEPEGIKVDYAVMPYERSIQQVRAGKADCLMGAYRTDAPDFIFPHRPWAYDHSMFYVRSDDPWRYEGNLNSLLDRNVGMILGYTFGDEFEVFVEPHKGKQFQYMGGQSPLLNNIRKLISGRLDTILEGQATIEWQQKQLAAQKKIIPAGELYPPEPLYIACGPKHIRSQRFVNLADKRILLLRSSGKLQELLDRYGLPHWQY